jgi:hypothetical protein
MNYLFYYIHYLLRNSLDYVKYHRSVSYHKRIAFFKLTLNRFNEFLSGLKILNPIYQYRDDLTYLFSIFQERSLNSLSYKFTQLRISQDVLCTLMEKAN